MIEVELPDGSIGEFPDGTPDSTIIAFINGGSGKSDPVQEFIDWKDPKDEPFLNPGTGQMTSRNLLEGAADTSRGKAFGLNMGQGSALQWGDEAVGAIAGALRGPDDARFAKEKIRSEVASAKRDFPFTSMGGEFVGAGATGAMSAPLGAGASMIGTTGRSMAIGGTEGLLYGGGRGETMEERGRFAVSDGIGGGLIGLAVPAALSLAKTAAGTPGGVANTISGKPDQVRANKLIGQTLKRSGKTVDEISDEVAQAGLLGQPEFRAVDALGDAGARRASGIANSGDRAATEIVDFLNTRQAGQGERVSQFVEEAFDTAGDTATQRGAALKEARNQWAKGAYDAATGNAGPVDLGGAIGSIDDAMRGVNSIDGGTTGLAETAIGRRLGAIRGQLQSGKMSTVDFREVLETKMELGRTVATIKKRGGDVPPAIAEVYGKLDQALEGASDAYRAANDGFRARSRAIDAIDEGAKMARPGARFQDNATQFNAMTPDQQASARVGYADKRTAEIAANKAPTADKAREFRSPKGAGDADTMAINPGDFRTRMANEKTMWETQNKAVGNSTTARKQVDIQEVTGGSEGVPQGLRSLGNFQVGDAAVSFLRPVMDAATGVNNETRRLVAQALLSDNPREAFNIALRQEMTGANRKTLIEAIGRSMAIRAKEEGQELPRLLAR